MAEIAYSVQRPTYPKAYSGTIPSGGWAAGPGNQVVIPRRHRREGDTDENEVASYTLTLLGAASDGNVIPGQVVHIYDALGSNPGYIIWGGNFFLTHTFVFSEDLRMACLNYSTPYYVLARYYLPIRA